VISYLEAIFGITKVIKKNSKTVVTNKKTLPLTKKDLIVVKDTVESGEAVQHIDSFDVYQASEAGQDINLKDYVNNVDVKELGKDDLYLHKGKKYSKVIVYTKLLEAPLLFFSVDRNFLGQKPLTKVIPPNTIKLLGTNPPKTRKTLHLSSILVHDGISPGGGHFRAYIKCGNRWYEYNDVGYNELNPVGTFRDMVEEDNFYVLRNASQFIYT
jgi:hypothetical protein